MPPDPATELIVKQRFYALAIALGLSALLLWWVYTLAFNAANAFQSVALPLLALLAFRALTLVARGIITPGGEYRAILVMCAFTSGVFIAQAIWPPPPAVDGLSSLLLIIVSLGVFLLLPPRTATIIAGALFSLAVLTAWIALARTGGSAEVGFGVFIEQVVHLAVIALLYSLVWLRQSWVRERVSRAHHERLAETDALTELPNRRGTHRVLRREIERGVPFSVILADIDGFKSINDQFGHQMGDEVLRRTAGILRRESRERDEVGRWGGEEFLVILPGTLLSDAVSVADRLRMRLADAPVLLDRRVSASFGVAQWRDGDVLETLVQRADEALYCAKEAGKNRVCQELERVV